MGSLFKLFKLKASFASSLLENGEWPSAGGMESDSSMGASDSDDSSLRGAGVEGGEEDDEFGWEYGQQRSRKRTTKEENLYGVFMEGSSGSGFSGSSSKRTKRGGEVKFVSSKTEGGWGEGGSGDDDENDDENDEGDGRDGGDEKDDEEDARRREESNRKFEALLKRAGGENPNRGAAKMKRRAQPAAAPAPAPTQATAPAQAPAPAPGGGGLGYPGLGSQEPNGIEPNKSEGGPSAAEGDGQFQGSAGLVFGFPSGGGASAPPRADPNLGKWEKHTKGFGLKMLQKLGFKGRLGAKEKGVSKTVEVVVRPGGLGLGFGGFKEAAQLKGNKVFEAQLRGEDVVDERDLAANNKQKPKFGNSITDRLLKEQAWKKKSATKGGADGNNKKGGVKKKKQGYKRAEDIVQSTLSSSSSSTLIDMRGPDAKVLTMDKLENGLGDAAADDWPSSTTGTPQIGAELVYNLSRVISNAEMNISTKAHLVKLESSKVKELEASIEADEKLLVENERRLAAMGTIKAILTSLHEDAESMNMGQVVASFQDIRKKFPAEFDKLDLQGLVPSFVSPLVKKELKGWNCFGEPSFASDLLISWKGLLESETLKELFDSLVFPMLQVQISNNWDVTRPSDALDLLDALKKILGDEDLVDLVEVFLSKVRNYIEGGVWDPSKSDIHIHTVVFPWLVHGDLQDIFPKIRRALSGAIKSKKWKVKDESVFQQVSPWLQVWDKKSFRNFISRCILPTLIEAIRKLVINPADQDLETFERVMQWKPCLTSRELMSILEGEFFLNWLNVLHSWLAANGGPDESSNYDSTMLKIKEAAEWYSDWKDVIGDIAVDDEMNCRFFMAALDIIDKKIAESRGGSNDDFVQCKPPKRDTTDYYKAHVRRTEEEKNAAKRGARFTDVGKSSASTLGESLSIRDIVTEKASRLGVFFQLAEKEADGRALYYFRDKKSTIYFNGDVVYGKGKGLHNTEADGAGTQNCYVPVSVNELFPA